METTHAFFWGLPQMPRHQGLFVHGTIRNAWLGFFIQKEKRACREGSFFPSLLHIAVSSLLHSIGKGKGQNRAKY